MKMRTHKYRTRMIFCCAAVLLATALTGCAEPREVKTAPDSDTPAIIVGSDNYPPYNYEDADGKPAGIDVDLATEAPPHGLPAVFTTIDWESKKELVEAGTIDCIWGSFSIDGREEQYRWTEPYMYSRQVVAVREDSPICSLADLEGARIAVQSTTKPEEIFLSHTDQLDSGTGGGLFPSKSGTDLSVSEQRLCGCHRRPRNSAFTVHGRL